MSGQMWYSLLSVPHCIYTSIDPFVVVPFKVVMTGSYDTSLWHPASRLSLAALSNLVDWPWMDGRQQLKRPAMPSANPG